MEGKIISELLQFIISYLPVPFVLFLKLEDSGSCLLKLHREEQNKTSPFAFHGTKKVWDNMRVSKCDRTVIFGTKVSNSHGHLKLVQPFLLQLFCLEQELKSNLPLLVGEEEPVAPLPEDKTEQNNCLKDTN